MAFNLMAHHHLKATPDTVHLGGFSTALPPALTVNSGDTIAVETYTGYYVYQNAPSEFVNPDFLHICQTLDRSRIVGNGPHLLTGPIFVNGAEPGDVLEVELQAIQPALSMGFNAVRIGQGALPDRFPDSNLRFVALDLQRNLAEFPPHSGIHIPLRPFFGILGVATADERSSIPPGHYGGNMDNSALVAGSRVFLPVLEPGALFSIGDGHAAQGDGEVCGTAIETSMNGAIALRVHKNFPLPVPLAETETDFVVMGFAPTLDEAFTQALNHMITLITHLTGIDPAEAYTLCSMAANFRISQVVNQPQKGVHGLIAKTVLRSPSLPNSTL